MANYSFKLQDILFQLLWSKKQALLVLLDTRNYQVGDIFEVVEYYPNGKFPHGRKISIRVTHTVKDAPWLTPGYCAFTFKIISKND